MKKTLALIIGIVLLMTTFAGCYGSASSQTTTLNTTVATTSTRESEPTTTKEPAEPVTITLLLAEQDSQWHLADTPNFKTIQDIFLKKYNVNYELETYVSSEMETTVSTLFASGSKLPDIVNYGYPINRTIDLYNNGLILKLNDLIDENAPDLKAFLGQRPLVAIANADSEGNILSIPYQYIENPMHRMTFMHIRYDWLKKVGMSYTDIKTPENLYEVLKAFQKNDVNENGKADEVLTGSLSNLNRALGTAFGIKYMTNAVNSWYYDKYGKVYNTMLTPETLDYITYMNKLYSEGLLDQTFMTETTDQFNEKLYNNEFAGLAQSWWISVVYNQRVAAKGFTVEYIPLANSISKSGDPFVYAADLSGSAGYLITKDCDDPAAAMKTINWGYTQEGTIQNYYGVSSKDEGSDYFVKPDVIAGLSLPDYAMRNTDAYTAAMAAESLLWYKMGWNRNFTTKLMLGNVDVCASDLNGSYTGCGQAAEISFNIDGLNYALSDSISAINFASPTVKQSEVWENYSDLWIYMDEQIGKFITGTRALNEWNDFVAKCESLDISGAMAIRQEQYDTYLSIIKNYK